MSYSCEINFKKMKAEEIIPFLGTLKKEIKEKLPEIAKENYSFCPLFVKHNLYTFPDDFSEMFFKTDYKKYIDEATAWAQNAFTYRYFYDIKLQMLGVYGVPNMVKHLFDGTVYFQNSCDQDYDKKDWAGIKEFEDIYDKWMRKPDKEIKEEYDKSEGIGEFDKNYKGKEEKELQYYRRTYAYREIWDKFKSTLFNDDTAIYFSAFRSSDFNSLYAFVKHCFEEGKQAEKRFMEEIRTKKEKQESEEER